MSDIAGASVFGTGLVLLSYLIYRYARYSPGWVDRAIGRAYMMTKVGMWCILAYALLANLFPDWEGRETLRFLLLTFVNVSILYQIITMVKIQRGGDRREDHESTRRDLMSGD